MNLHVCVFDAGLMCAVLLSQVASFDVNVSKQEIDGLNQQLEGKRAAAGAAAAAAAGEGRKEEVLDDEQYVYIQQLKASKAK
jgi:hypothetical protein